MTPAGSAGSRLALEAHRETDQSAEELESPPGRPQLEVRSGASLGQDRERLPSPHDPDGTDELVMAPVEALGHPEQGGEPADQLPLGPVEVAQARLALPGPLAAKRTTDHTDGTDEETPFLFIRAVRVIRGSFLRAVAQPAGAMS